MITCPQNKNLSHVAQLPHKDEEAMASSAQTSLQAAITAMERAFARLESATDVALHERAQSAAQREAGQAEISLSWQSHCAQLEATLAEANSENEFLKEDNLHHANQLQKLQQEFLELQSAAGHAVGRLDRSVKQLDLILEH
jgi:hypothetical protein